jgi:lipopolysaccharide export system permease protein
MGEYIAPIAENEAQLGRAQALEKTVKKSGPGYWLRDGADFVNFGEVLPDLSILNVNIYSFDGITLRSQLHAERARHREDRWTLEQVKRSDITDKQVRTLHVDSLPWQTALTPNVVAVFTVQPEQLSIRYLHSYIEHLSRNGQSTERYRLVLWQKLLMPLSVVVMVLLASPFAFGQLRSGGMSQRVFVGVMLGLAVVIVNRLTGHFGVLYGMNPILAALVPILACFAGAMWLLRRAS